MKRNSKTICGRKIITPPTPAMMPLAIRSFKSPGGSASLAASCSAPNTESSRSIGNCAHEKIVWKTNNKIPTRINNPKTLCVRTPSSFSLKERSPDSSRSLTDSCTALAIQL